MPASGTKHRPMKTKTSIEGTFLSKRKLKKGRANVFKAMHVGLGRQLKEAEAILAEEDTPIDCSHPCNQELLQKKFPEVVPLAAFGVRKCQGCKGEIIRTKCPLP